MSLNRHGNKNKLSNLFTGRIKGRKPGSAPVGTAARLFRHVVFVYVVFLRLNRCLWFSFTPCPALPLAASVEGRETIKGIGTLLDATL